MGASHRKQPETAYTHRQVTFRAKGKGSGCALGLNPVHRAWMQHPGAYSLRVHVERDSNGDVKQRLIHLRANPEGYTPSFKYEGAPTAELSVSYNLLDVQPPDGKREHGTLGSWKSFTRSGAPALTIDITDWVAYEDTQATLFGETDRLLLPGQKAVPDNDPVIT
jgi:hypothetical protein